MPGARSSGEEGVQPRPLLAGAALLKGAPWREGIASLWCACAQASSTWLCHNHLPERRPATRPAGRRASSSGCFPSVRGRKPCVPQQSPEPACADKRSPLLRWGPHPRAPAGGHTVVAATGGLVVVAVGHRSCALTAEAGERPRRRLPALPALPRAPAAWVEGSPAHRLTGGAGRSAAVEEGRAAAFPAAMAFVYLRGGFLFLAARGDLVCRFPLPALPALRCLCPAPARSARLEGLGFPVAERMPGFYWAALCLRRAQRSGHPWPACPPSRVAPTAVPGSGSSGTLCSPSTPAPAREAAWRMVHPVCCPQALQTESRAPVPAALLPPLCLGKPPKVIRSPPWVGNTAG